MIMNSRSCSVFLGAHSLLAVLSCGLFSLSCADTGHERVEVPLYLSGTDVSEPVTAVGDIPVFIQRADLAFGPLYLCAGNTAGDLCDSARAEWLETAVVDTTDESSVAVGTLSGITGTVQSWMYDLAISSQLTRSKPFVRQAAEDLGDSSFVVEGRVLLHGVDLPFLATVPISQNDTTELGVPVIRKSAASEFFHDMDGRDKRLILQFDPSTWLSRLDFRPYLVEENCEANDQKLVCQGQTEVSCTDGSPGQLRDCSELQQVCLAGIGCADELVVEEGTQAYRSLAIALTTTGRPIFKWTD